MTMGIHVVQLIKGLLVCQQRDPLLSAEEIGSCFRGEQGTANLSSNKIKWDHYASPSLSRACWSNENMAAGNSGRRWITSLFLGRMSSIARLMIPMP